MLKVFVLLCVCNFVLSTDGKTHFCNDRGQLDFKELHHKKNCTLEPLKTNVVTRLYDCASLCLYENQCWMISVHRLDNKMIECSLFNNTCEGSFENTDEKVVVYKIRVASCRKYHIKHTTDEIVTTAKPTESVTAETTKTTTEALTATTYKAPTTEASTTTAITTAITTTNETPKTEAPTITTTSEAQTTTTEAPPTTTTEVLATPFNQCDNVFAAGNYHDTNGDASFKIDLATKTKPYPASYEVSFSREVMVSSGLYTKSHYRTNEHSISFTFVFDDRLYNWYTNQYLSLQIHFTYERQAIKPYVTSVRYGSLYCQNTLSTEISGP